MREAMPTRDEMTIDERRKYVKLMAERYRKAKRKERSQLLSEMEQVSQLHRKHLIRLLNGESLERKKRSTSQSRTYGLEVERVVLLGRSYQAMERAFNPVLERVPFAVKELHPDNGTEFFNYDLVRFWKEKVTGVHLSRSRRYQKNDNRHVQQKHDSLGRQYCG